LKNGKSQLWEEVVICPEIKIPYAFLAAKTGNGVHAQNSYGGYIMKKRECLLMCAVVLAIGGLVSCVAYHDKDRPTTGGGQAAKYPKDAVQPVTLTQCTRIGDVSFRIDRGKDSCIAKLTAYSNTTCAGTGKPIQADKNSKLFVGPLEGNSVCPEAVSVSKSSPCFFYEFYSDGWYFPICWHDPEGFIDPTLCINHTAPCGEP